MMSNILRESRGQLTGNMIRSSSVRGSIKLSTHRVVKLRMRVISAAHHKYEAFLFKI